jgi:hypothetical protein
MPNLATDGKCVYVYVCVCVYTHTYTHIYVYILKRILKKCCVRMWTGFTRLKLQPSREFMDMVMNMCIHVPYKK